MYDDTVPLLASQEEKSQISLVFVMDFAFSSCSSLFPHPLED